jgi:2-methylcitrate dehydratase PrpD
MTVLPQRGRTTVTATATERFADFAVNADWSDVPAPVLDAVCLHLLDVLGCGLAAVGTGAAPYALTLSAASASGPATAFGSPRTLAASAAALVNGIACHALDFDDTHGASIAHVSTVVAPAALAAAEAVEASGRDLAVALLVGSEITCRIGEQAGDAFHLRGFHPTAICGVFGATAAVGRLTGLAPEQIRHALGIAGSMAGGLMAYLSDGSDTKRVHAGWMAHAAHHAVELAAAGATGPAAVLEGRHGVFESFLGRDVEGSAFTRDLGSRWVTPEIAFKPYPACHFLHAPLDALAALVRDHSVDIGDIERITVQLPRAGMDLVAEPIERKRRPATPYEGKFSAPFSFAAWLHTGRLDVTTFREALLADPRILATADIVDAEEAEFSSFPRALPGAVRVVLRSGRTLERTEMFQRGGPDHPMTSEDVLAKFRGNAGLAMPHLQHAELERWVMTLGEQADLSGFRLLGMAAAS